VPRADHLKEFFHDDIYPPVRSTESTVSASEWGRACAAGEGDSLNLNPVLESLQPAGMIRMSEKPVSATKEPKVNVFRDEIKKAEEEKDRRENSFSRLQSMAIQRSMYHPNSSGGSKPVSAKCDATPVHDEDDDDGGWDD